MTTYTMDRRGFLKGAAGVAAGAAAGAAAVPVFRKASEAVAEENGAFEPSDPVETLEADVAVIGAGISGLAAAVQAGGLGLKTVVLECNDFVGGNGLGTEGIFAIGSARQQELGIELTLADIVAKEQDFFKYKVNALYWKDMAEQSSATLEWLEGNGVGFSGTVDDYPPLGSVKTMHWWADGQGSSYAEPMAAKAAELGADIHLATRARKLILEEGKVAGVYAANENGETVQVNAPVVILATGGFADSPEKLSAAGVNPDEVFVRSFGGHRGDAIDMAVQAGARDMSLTSAFLRETTIRGVDFATPFSMFFFTTGQVMWVNQDGERFADENCLSITSGCQSNANSNQGQTYTLFSQTILDAAGEAAATACAELLEAGSDEVVKADTLEELAETFGIPAETLVSEVERYNGFCDGGADEDFGKDAGKLARIETPFYMAKMSYCYMSSIGGIQTSRKAEVMSAEGKPVPGLYAVGSDGCELYAGTYTISVCSSYNGNNVYSGRNAARNACAYLGR